MADLVGANRTVVGIDGSRASAAALDWALADSHLRVGEVDIVHAWTPSVVTFVGGVPVTADPLESEVAAKQLLESVAEAAVANAAAQPPTVRTRLLRGDASAALVSESRTAQQLVVGADGLGALARVVIGSTTDKCVEDALSTVTVVPQSDKLGDGRVVVGVDDSEASVVALRWAFEAAHLRGAALVVVHAVPSALDFLGYRGRAFALGNGRLLIQDMLDSIADGNGTPRSLRVVSKFGSPAQLLLEVAEGATLLVVGADRRGPVGHLLSRTARKCVHRAPCPVTVVKIGREP